MHLLNKISIKNFRGFREEISANLENSSYFVGPNNSGKTSILDALRLFFNKDILIDENIVNKTAFLSKKEKSNQVEVTIEFNLNNLTLRTYQKKLIKKFGPLLNISKIFSVATDTKAVSQTYKVNNSYVDMLTEDITRLINSIKITYLHPQEGKELLHNAQIKLKQRLLANWGRNSNITESINELQKVWDDLRSKTNRYLSSALTENLQNMWPKSSVAINLPRNIKDIIGVSNISFFGYDGAPEIDLTLQGTGAQTTILYLAHFLLDSDRSLHRGEYHPLWLIEEPESFLHADLLASLSKQLNSNKWLQNIQMVVSTHSPILLAGTRLAKDKVIWTILERHSVRSNKSPINYVPDEIKSLGQMMGDPSFFTYFTIIQDKKLVFLEDTRPLTLKVLSSSGIPVSEGLSGISVIKKCLDTLMTIPQILFSEAYFLVDSDNGKSEIKKYIAEMFELKSKNGFRKLKHKDHNIYLILLPDGDSVEDLFDEYNYHLVECKEKIWDEDFSIKTNIPASLSRTVSCARAKHSVIKSSDDAIKLIKNDQDVKDLFWKKVEINNYQVSREKTRIIKSFLK